MPTYEYECLKCGRVFDVFQPITAKHLKYIKHKVLVSDKAIKPNCKGKVKRLISGGGGIIFKGKGFYCNDYKKITQKEIDNKEEKCIE